MCKQYVCCQQTTADRVTGPNLKMADNFTRLDCFMTYTREDIWNMVC